MTLTKLFANHGYFAPADGDADGGGGAADDRGDDAVLPDAADSAAEAEGSDAAAAEKAEAEKAAAEKAAAEKKAIPKARFDEAVKKEREKAEKAEARAKDLEARLKVQQDGLDSEKVTKEIEALEDELDKAIADGDAEKKKALRAQIREKTNAIARSEAEKQAAYATAVAVERVRYDAAVGLMEAEHPEINPDSESYDEEIAAEVIELKAAYEATGMGSTEALKKAAKYVFKTAPAEVKGEKKDDADPDAKAAADKAAAEKAAKLKEEAIRRSADVRARQPAAEADRVGKSSDKAGGVEKSAVRMKDSEFDKLSDDEKARMRGDIL